ncbi:MAG: Ig-like domain repeat protein [Treponemataceae bacterium]|nr:Ig-like domain repeat protein [Treponemataceae bacterium]
MQKKVIAGIFLGIAVSTCALFSSGKKELEEISVQNLESWQESFPIEEKKPGVYNIMVTANDKGGNTTVVGPYNIYIDPNSDLPVSGITNPHNGMRVPGNLNIVGTCVDDDEVSYVEIVLDGNEERPVRAEGKEFWSYYLDTSKLEEGEHTVAVTGVDIYGTRGETIYASWHLDRKQPITEISSHGIGELVSGKIKLEGEVKDGNGIESLEYSLDGGVTFEEISVKYNKTDLKWTFSLTVDTRDLDDGPQVCWFRAEDTQGSIGVSSYLFFVDNTKPDVDIITPAEDESVNGIFQIAGSAYDVIGLSSMTWEFEKEKGEFDLIPGNPYWFKEFDVREINSKKVKFSINVVDKAGNVTKVDRTITIDKESDFPVVEIVEPEIDPTSKTGPLVEDEFYLRGNVTDDDCAAEFHWYIDKDGEDHLLETEGVFYADILNSLPDKLSVGEHTLFCYAVDITGVVGNTVSFPFTIKGDSPVITLDTVTEKIDGKNTDSDYIPGMELHPERDGILKGTVSSECGLTGISWKINGRDSGSEILKGTKDSVSYEIPLDSAPWGLVQIEVSAVDVYDRSVSEKFFVYRTNLSKNRDSSAVVFSDSTSENGIINFADTKTVSGYFTGGKAVSIALEPDEGFARAKLSGNSIILTSTGKTGKSSPTRVIVTTDKELVYKSSSLTFDVELAAPELILDQTTLLDGFNKVFVSGRVGEAGSRLKKLTLSAEEIKQEAPYEGSIVAEYRIIKSAEDIGNWKKLSLYGSGDFFLELKSSAFDEGITIIEFASYDSGSKKTIKAAAVKKVSPLPAPNPDDPKAKPPVAAAPVIRWIQGEQLYFTCYYQDSLSFTSLTAAGQSLLSTDVDFLFPEAGAVPYSYFPAGKSNAEIRLADVKNKSAVLKTDIIRPGNVSAVIDSVNDVTYSSGMQVELPAPGSKNQTASMKVRIHSDLPITSCTYSIADKPSSSGKVQKVTGSDGVVIPDEFEVYIPLKDVEALSTDITVSFIIDKTINKTLKGTISVVRALPEAGVDDKEKIYWIEPMFKDKSYGYLLEKDVPLYGFVNVSAPYTVLVKCEQEGLFIEQFGKTVAVKAKKEAFYEDVYLVVRDSEGIEYESGKVSFAADYSDPSVTILSPKNHVWIQESVGISVDAQDSNGIGSVEYSIHDGKNWRKMETDENGIYQAEVSVAAFKDGLLPLDVRVTDNTGKTSYKRLTMAKDTQAPVVTTVLPEAGASVNGRTLFVVKAEDNGRIVSGKCVLPVVSEKESPASDEEVEGIIEEEAEVVIEEEEPVVIDLGDKKIVSLVIGAEETPLSSELYFSYTDAAGNVADYKDKPYKIDLEADKPRVEIHLPDDDTILITDFTVSGIIYDDDGDSYVWFSIDDAPPVRSKEAASNWSFDIKLDSLDDNEHTITVFAEDILGVRGDSVQKIIKVSREEPKGEVISPTLEESLSGRISISGKAADGNGIKLVQISIDNGNTWQDAVGTEEWSYALDTRIIEDGTHVVFLKVWDNYDIQGLYSSLINIDNTAPDINLELPVDDMCLKTGNLKLSGHMTDNVGLSKLYVKIRNMDPAQPEVPEEFAYRELDIEQIINCDIDISSLENGFYNVEVTGEDAANNITRVSRNILVDSRAEPVVLNLLYPLDGEHICGNFSIYGNAETEEKLTNLSLLMDGKEIGGTTVTETNHFVFQLTPEQLIDGNHTYKVRTTLNDGSVIYSEEQSFVYVSTGPWVAVNGFIMGDFAIDRPFITGEAGYILSDEEMMALESKETSKYERNLIKQKALDKVEISLDNGKSFLLVGNKPEWKFRIENDEYTEGSHHVIVRATMKNGETAVTRTIFQIDKTSPVVKLITPNEAGRYNSVISFAGLSSDDVSLRDVTLSLRSGDKSNYEVPSFIQGLYLEGHLWGVTLFDVGIGLTFFDNNVKLQFQYGQMFQGQFDFMHNVIGTDTSGLRYGGHVFGAKLLANIASIPFSYFFGPDLSWLSATFGLGANFSMFTETQSKKPQILSAFLGQMEFPKVTFKDRTMFSTFSFYTEFQVWFIPTDIESQVDINSIVPQLSFGLRFNVF